MARSARDRGRASGAAPAARRLPRGAAADRDGRTPDGGSHAAGLDPGAAIDRAGVLLWAVEIDPPSFGQVVQAADGTLYVGTETGKLQAIDRDGVRWSFETAGPIPTPAIGPDGTIYTRGGDGALYAIRADGRRRWTTDIGAEPRRLGPAPLIGPDGYGYLTSYHQGMVYLVQLPRGSENGSATIGGRPTPSRSYVGGDAMPPLGYMGNILEVDLTSGAITTTELTQELADRWIGGTGLGAYLLAQEPATATADPLSPENTLIFGTGPYTGTAVPLSNRFGVCARSPLTGVFGEAECGGHWANNLKKAGYDMLVLRGKAPKPVYLWVHDDGVEIRDAAHVWGKDTFETHDMLIDEVGSTGRRGEEAEVACIGPAGERLARVAAIMVDGRDGRSAGRCGLGAVMGSKQLKAVVARGTKPVRIHDEQALKEALNRVRRDIVQQAKGFGALGTAGGIPTHEKMGNWPIKNWQQSHWPEGPDKISGATMAESILTGRYYCGNCIIGCGRTVEVKEGPYAGIEQGGLEYETTALNGSNLLVGDLAAVQKANELCNRYGMDTISAGAVIGFAMEAYQRGLLTQEDTGGIDLVWGSDQALVEAMTRMGERDSEFGRRLGEGTARLAEEVGGEDFAIHVRGLDFPAHDPRAFFANAVAYATSARGACHLSSFGHTFQRVLTLPELGYDEPVHRHDAERTPELVLHGQNLMGLFDSLKVCKFIMFGGMKPTHLLEWYNAITGRGLDIEQFMEIGSRIFTQKRLYNAMCGSTGADDVLPRRIVEEARETGGTEQVPPFALMLKEYYRVRGWDEQGTPLPETLEQLGLRSIEVAAG